MRNALVLIAFLMGASFIPLSASADGGKDCDRVKNAECDLIRHGLDRKVIPVDDLVCIHVIQPEPGNVFLLVLFPGQREPRYYVKYMNKKEFICFGRDWAKLAEFIFLCNEFTGSEYFSRAETSEIAKKPKYGIKPGACLYGEEACAGKGYKPLRDLAPEERHKIDAARARFRLLPGGKLQK